VSIPGNRIFVIGGSQDIECNVVHKTTYEVADGQLVERASMWNARAGFGCAIYPNYSQIFIAGGSTSRETTTKHCERYIVATDTWKRLPELRQSRF